MHLSWHSAFDSCELFYSHVTNCIKRTNGMVIDAFTVFSFLAAVCNESFIKVILCANCMNLISNGRNQNKFLILIIHYT